ncbi:hypothetical protein PISL3812_01800 [Talaromyces islandicus]|uniref:Uncharacterized protein n=1 Tax=Talaromyces islandicus TaxID=28573 RepID=A0A0U1LQJ6_TALIS|nr:hypothetical protein PISL3812_01800 [Talaromyces islandicus]
MKISEIDETGTAEPCYALGILGPSENETTTVNKGYRKDAPLTAQQGSHELWIKMIADDQPFKCPHLHVRAIKSEPRGRHHIPYFNMNESTRIAVVFQSKSGPEKEQKIETAPVTGDKIPLGSHDLQLGDLHILLIGYIPLDFVVYHPDGKIAECLTDFIPVNLNFWLRVVDEKDNPHC